MTYKIKSTFIRGLIKGKPFSYRDSQYIDDIIFIERWISGNAKGMGSSMRWIQEIKKQYVKEIKEIWTELDTEGYMNFLKRETKLTQEWTKLNNQVKDMYDDELKSQKKQWLDAGGIL